jgi:predicted RNA-binding Zn-ribbon protein involved in translation (DUF1610 family)
MYADYLVVYARFAVTPTDASGREAGCMVTLSTCIAFLSPTFLQGPIVAEFLKHAPWVHRQWAALAQEHVAAGAAHGSPSPLEGLVQATANAAGSSSRSDGSSACAVAAAAQLDLGATLRHSPVGRALSRAMASGSVSPQGAAKRAPASQQFGPAPPLHIAPPEPIEGFICPVCGLLSASQGRLVAHYTSHHMDDTLKRTADSGSSDDSDDSACGGEDGKGSDDRCGGGGGPQLDGRNRTAPLSTMEAPATATGFVCPECYGKFGSAKELTLHYTIQHGDIPSHRPPSSLPWGATAGRSGKERVEGGEESVSEAMVRDLRASVDSMASLFTAEWP